MFAFFAFGALTVATLGDAVCGISGPSVEQLTVVMRIINVGTVAKVEKAVSPADPLAEFNKHADLH